MYALNVDARTLEVVLASAERMGAQSDVGLLRSFFEVRSDRDRDVASSSRQARHKRTMRALRRAIVAAMVSAIDEPEIAQVVMSPAFARLRPLSASGHRAFMDLVRTRFPISPGQTEKLWSIGATRLYDLAGRLCVLPSNELLCVHSALACMHAAAIALGNRASSMWRDFWNLSARAGVLEHGHLHMQLSLMGGHTGECGPAVDWVVHPQSHAITGRIRFCLSEAISPRT